ncbi:MAG: lysine--tRNA ligase [SAR324 cluster bacterium]|nr:lysine--tRNA ligase [SAR324 cluster bacterium]
MAVVAWAKNEAEKVLKAHSDLEKEILFETGFGPSGLPHIGTFAEVVRTLYVLEAVKELEPKAKTRLIVFCDDMDGLRSLPQNVPNHDLLRPSLGAPLSSIPDPFGETDSFSGYMNGKLREFLDSYGFEYEYRSSTDCYKSGVFDDGLKAVMDNYDKIKETFVKTIAENKREAWSPFFVICEKCGKIYTTRVTKVDPANYEVSYTCDQSSDTYESCGHVNTTSILGGAAKVGWKVDWALRWFVFGVDYEMYGKDLMESATLSGKICRILGGKTPTPYKYELFLDENGAKISKKIGNGISMDQWLKFAPLGALLNFLLGNPNKAKKMGMPILPRLVDEYLQAMRGEASDVAFEPAWFLNRVRKKPLSSVKELTAEVGFSLLYNVAEAVNLYDPDMLFDYAFKYDGRVEEDNDLYRELVGKVAALAKEVNKSKAPFDFTPDEQFIPLFSELVTHIESLGEDMKGDELQTKIFSLAKDQELNPKDFFAFLYGLILNKSQGPKLGPFFALMGKDESMKLLKKGLSRLGV